MDAVVNDSRIVEVIQPAPGIQCQELVLSPKGLGTALVTVYDIGIHPPLSASSVVIYVSTAFFLQVLVIVTWKELEYICIMALSICTFFHAHALKDMLC